MKKQITVKSFVPMKPIKPWKENFKEVSEKVQVEIREVSGKLLEQEEDSGSLVYKGKTYKKAEVISCWAKDYQNATELLLNGAYGPRLKLSDRLFSMDMANYESREEVLGRLNKDADEFLFVGEELYVANPSNLVLFKSQKIRRNCYDM